MHQARISPSLYGVHSTDRHALSTSFVAGKAKKWAVSLQWSHVPGQLRLMTKLLLKFVHRQAIRLNLSRKSFYRMALLENPNLKWMSTASVAEKRGHG